MMRNKSTIFYLVRHGESEYNKAGIISGQVNPSLTEKGHEQARQAKESLSGILFDVVYSSDLDRALKTAEIIHGKPIPSENRLKKLRERSFGSIDGKSQDHIGDYREVKRKMTKEVSRTHKHVPDMESDQELADRILGELKRLAVKHPGQTILIGSHGTAMRIVSMQIQNKHFKDMPKDAIKNGGYIKIIYNDGNFEVEEVNV